VPRVLRRPRWTLNAREFSSSSPSVRQMIAPSQRIRDLDRFSDCGQGRCDPSIAIPCIYSHPVTGHHRSRIRTKSWIPLGSQPLDYYRELAETKRCPIVALNNVDHIVNPVHIYCGCTHQIFCRPGLVLAAECDVSMLNIIMQFAVRADRCPESDKGNDMGGIII
jgi:hypothetical protein